MAKQFSPSRLHLLYTVDAERFAASLHPPNREETRARQACRTPVSYETMVAQSVGVWAERRVLGSRQNLEGVLLVGGGTRTPLTNPQTLTWVPVINWGLINGCALPAFAHIGTLPVTPKGIKWSRRGDENSGICSFHWCRCLFACPK